MKLYLIRHASAEDAQVFAQTGLSDELRPLTPKGEEKMRDVLNFFKKNEAQLNIVLSSPLTRCLQTTEIFKEYYPGAHFVTTENLRPDHSAQRLYDEIMQYEVDSVALIGHEPFLGQFISWLLFRQASDHFPMKKSGIAKLDIYKDGRVYFKWLLRPKLLFRN